MPRKKPEKIIPIETFTFIDDGNEEVTIEVYDDNNLPNGRGDKQRYGLTDRVTRTTDKIIDELLKGKDASFLDNPSAFRSRCDSLALLHEDEYEEEYEYEDEDEKALSKDHHSSYRKNVYVRVKRELEILFNAIDNQPANERNKIGSHFHSAYSKHKIEKK